MDVANAIRAELARKRIPTAQVHKLLGNSRAYWSRRVNGDVSPTVDDLLQLAELLDISIGVFFGIENAPSPRGPGGGERARRDSNPQPSDPKSAGLVLDGRDRFEQRRAQRSTSPRPDRIACTIRITHFRHHVSQVSAIA